MILALDVFYFVDHAIAGGVLFQHWRDATESARYVENVPGICVADYVPGEFYKRELPCLCAVIDRLDVFPSAIVIDGYVTLDASGRPGLGMHLWDSLDQKIPIIGVAKNRFSGTPAESELFRGNSQRPLYVTAVGMPLEEAKANIGNMHGKYRIPTLLKKVDQLSREATPARSELAS